MCSIIRYALRFRNSLNHTTKIAFLTLALSFSFNSDAALNTYLFKGTIEVKGKNYPVYVKTEYSLKRVGMDQKIPGKQIVDIESLQKIAFTLPPRTYTTKIFMKVPKPALAGSSVKQKQKPVNIHTNIDHDSNAILQDAQNYEDSPLEWLLAHALSMEDMIQGQSKSSKLIWLVLNIQHQIDHSAGSPSQKKTEPESASAKGAQNTDTITITAEVKADACADDDLENLQPDASLELTSDAHTKIVSVWSLLHDKVNCRSFSPVKQRVKIKGGEPCYLAILAEPRYVNLLVNVDKETSKAQVEIDVATRTSGNERRVVFQLKGHSELTSQAEIVDSLNALLDSLQSAPPKPTPHTAPPKPKRLHGNQSADSTPSRQAVASSKSGIVSPAPSLLSLASASISAVPGGQADDTDLLNISSCTDSQKRRAQSLLDEKDKLMALSPFYLWSYISGASGYRPEKVFITISEPDCASIYDTIEFLFDLSIPASDYVSITPDTFDTTWPPLSFFSKYSDKASNQQTSALFMRALTAISGEFFATKLYFSYFIGSDSEIESESNNGIPLGEANITNASFLAFMARFLPLVDTQAAYMDTDFSQEELDPKKIKKQRSGELALLLHNKIPLGYQTTYPLKDGTRQYLIWTRLSAPEVDELYRSYCTQCLQNVVHHETADFDNQDTSVSTAE